MLASSSFAGLTAFAMPAGRHWRHAQAQGATDQPAAHPPSATLGKALHRRAAANLADLVRIMNTYYSNLIEGHDIPPRDIERALAGQLDKEEGRRRHLQLEAAAHVRVQREVDRMVDKGALPAPASSDFLLWLHRRAAGCARGAVAYPRHRLGRSRTGRPRQRSPARRMTTVVFASRSAVDCHCNCKGHCQHPLARFRRHLCAGAASRHTGRQLP
jgi:hypothetical protein